MIKKEFSDNEDNETFFQIKAKRKHDDIDNDGQEEQN